MVKKRKNLTDSAHEAKMMHSVSELSRQMEENSAAIADMNW